MWTMNLWTWFVMYDLSHSKPDQPWYPLARKIWLFYSLFLLGFSNCFLLCTFQSVSWYERPHWLPGDSLKNTFFLELPRMGPSILRWPSYLYACVHLVDSVYFVLWDWGSLMLLFFRRIWCEGSPWTPEWTPSYIGWGRATCWNHWCSPDASPRDPWRSAKACGMPSTPLSF